MEEQESREGWYSGTGGHFSVKWDSQKVCHGDVDNGNHLYLETLRKF